MQVACEPGFVASLIVPMVGSPEGGIHRLCTSVACLYHVPLSQSMRQAIVGPQITGRSGGRRWWHDNHSHRPKREWLLDHPKRAQRTSHVSETGGMLSKHLARCHTYPKCCHSSEMKGKRLWWNGKHCPACYLGLRISEHHGKEITLNWGKVQHKAPSICC